MAENFQSLNPNDNDINVHITGKAASDLRHLARSLGVTPEEVLEGV